LEIVSQVKTMTTLTIGTRKSQLARWQTNHVIDLIKQAWPEVDCRIYDFETQGDKTLDKPLPQIGGKGLFTWELEEALRNGRIDIAVHSLKDLPVEDAPGLTLGAIVGRADVRDVVITADGRQLADLPEGAVVGTSSLRRQAQLQHHFPHLITQSIRGNVETRIRKVMEGQYDATILAAAGITRLGLTTHVSEWLPLNIMLPAPGQGALGIQCRRDDDHTRKLLAAIHNTAVYQAVTAERTFLNALGGGCATPVAAYATVNHDTIHLSGLVGAVDGTAVIQTNGSGTDPAALGRELAQKAIADGAEALLQHA
jgi:hydroxymethylbilane synthase